MRPNVTVRGVTGRTILRKAGGVSAALQLDGDYGEEQFTIAQDPWIIKTDKIDPSSYYGITVANGMISPPLEKGTYDVAVEATDPAGNVGRDTTTNELTIDW